MITVDVALTELFKLCPVMANEEVALADAVGRVLAGPVAARRNQPPFPASAMDGYALSEATPGKTYTVVGESAAGHGFDQSISVGQAVRIFTGAPVPPGADRVIIQEDVTREGDVITLNDGLDPQSYVRPAGGDFKIGEEMTPRVLSPSDIALLAAMNVPNVAVKKRPEVALIATGDELVMPGETPGPDQIIASNGLGLTAMLTGFGAQVRMLPIARDNEKSLTQAFQMAAEADLIVTIGGASVGDHDLVAPVADALGMERSFYRLAMRPGKPLMAGQLGTSAMIGLPGNPVSSMVCGLVFIKPMILAMLGLGQNPLPRKTAKLSQDLSENGPREHYMRATVSGQSITPFDRQDSSLLSVLSAANALLVRPVRDPARKAGDTVEYIDL